MNYFEKYKYMNCMNYDEKKRIQNLENSFYDELPCETSSKTGEPTSQKNLEWDGEFKFDIQRQVTQILTFDEPLQQNKNIEYDFNLSLSQSFQFEYDNQPQAKENYEYENNSEILDNFDNTINYTNFINKFINVKKNKKSNEFYMNNLINSNIEASRKNKKSLIKDGHTRDRPDNMRDQAGTAFMEAIHSFLEIRCKKYNLKIKKPNFKKQFGWNCILNEKFIGAKLYQIYIFNKKENKDVIRIMTKIKKDKEFIDIMKCTFENLYNKYIEEEDNNTKCIDENGQQKSFYKLTYMIEQKRNKLKEKNKKKLTEEEINQKIENFEKYSKNLIKDIKGDGELQKRSPKDSNFTLCDYEIMSELE